MKIEKKNCVKTTIVLPAALNEKLLREAVKEKRSRHSQIIYALEKAFERADTEKASGKSAPETQI